MIAFVVIRAQVNPGGDPICAITGFSKFRPCGTGQKLLSSLLSSIIHIPTLIHSLNHLYITTMADCVAIVQDLPFRQMVCGIIHWYMNPELIHQVIETAMHVSRSVTSDQAAYREFMTHFDTAATVKEGEEISAERKQEIVRELVKKVTEGQGCLQGNKETGGFFSCRRMREGLMKDAEPVHALLQHMLADNFDSSSEEYATLVKSVVEAIMAGASAASSAGRTSRVEAASRM